MGRWCPSVHMSILFYLQVFIIPPFRECSYGNFVVWCWSIVSTISRWPIFRFRITGPKNYVKCQNLKIFHNFYVCANPFGTLYITFLQSIFFVVAQWQIFAKWPSVLPEVILGSVNDMRATVSCITLFWFIYRDFRHKCSVVLSRNSRSHSSRLCERLIDERGFYWRRVFMPRFRGAVPTWVESVNRVAMLENNFIEWDGSARFSFEPAIDSFFELTWDRCDISENLHTLLSYRRRQGECVHAFSWINSSLFV